MSLAVLVRRNVLDPVRSRSIWILLGVFALLFGLIGYMIGSSNSTGLAFVVASVMAGLGPLAALAFTYDSIAGPRQSGSLRVLLSYPYSRRELVLGTLIGRILIVGLGVTVGVVAGALSMLVFGGTVDFGLLVPILGLSLLLSTAVVAIAIGISASVRTSSRAAVMAFGAYLLFSAFWNLIPSVVRYVLNGFSAPMGEQPQWVFVWNQLNPINAFRTATTYVLQEPISDAFYHAIWFSLLVLLGWFVLSAALGVVRFERTDL